MSVIQNLSSLASSAQRKIVLELVDAAFSAIAPSHIMEKHFDLAEDTLTIQGKPYKLSSYKRIFLVGFGKGSSGICKIVEQKLGDKLTKGWDIDVVDETFHKVSYTKGTHPLPSQENIEYTQTVLKELTHLTEEDLVLIVICGGGSVLFEAPNSLTLEELTSMNKALLTSGATISEMNVIRKHVSSTKGGGLAKRLFPAHIVSLIFSDVPGNDLSVIASGPTVKDPTTLEEASEIIKKYNLEAFTKSTKTPFEETPKEDKYFATVSNILMVSNKTALLAMQEKAKELGYKAFILTDRLQGDAKKIGKVLLSETKPKEILLAAGETTVHVVGKGTGGRNQALVLATLPYITNEVIVSFDSDGWDFTTFAGAIGDAQTIAKARELGLDLETFLRDDNSTPFFQKTGDGILTNKLESNVSDLMIVLKP
ncbi:MAG TPA: DUF4147 domain-containing protein [Patescibacteria group bacterium]|nr:DUF4147 domain-containing protein [Patescibacteria group bacterium]